MYFLYDIDLIGKRVVSMLYDLKPADFDLKPASFDVRLEFFSIGRESFNISF